MADHRNVLPEDPYRQQDDERSYTRASRLAAAVPTLRIVGWIAVALAWPLAGGYFIDGFPPLWIAWLDYIVAVALLLTPAIARVRIRSTPELAGDGRAPAPKLEDALEEGRAYVIAFATGAMLLGATLVPLMAP